MTPRPPRIPHTRPVVAISQRRGFNTLLYSMASGDARLDTRQLNADLEGYLTDLLTDLRHLAAARGLDFRLAVAASLNNYQQETQSHDQH